MHPFESVTVTVIGKVPVCVGVPESTPVVDRLRPVGSVLKVVKFAVPMAPLSVNVWLNGAAATPLFTAGGVTVMVWQTMVRLSYRCSRSSRLL